MACRVGPAPRDGRSVGTRDIPIRRYGTLPAWLEEEICYEAEPEPTALGIGERGGVAVLLAGLSAACIAGYLLYVA